MRMPFKPSQAALAVTLALLAGAAGAVPGYVTSGENTAITDSSGNCWRAGHWTPEMAAAPCDAVPRAATPAAPIAQREQPPVAPAPLAAPAPVVIEKVNLSSDVLFEFDKAELLPGGQKKLDELASNIKDARVDKVQIVGYADRIGSEQYNEQLSQRRAESVQQYLASKLGGDAQRVQAEGRGEANPVTGDQCSKMGPEKKSNQKLVACLQPDRRVEVEVLGERQAAGAGSAPSTGASAAPASGASSSSSSGTSAPASK